MSDALIHPHFLIIGAAKSATSSTWRYLVQHPAIYSTPRKSTDFFYLYGKPPAYTGPRGPKQNADPVIWKREDYAGFFAGAAPDQITGEASPIYLTTPGVAERVAAERPDVKIICIFRHPADAAFSRFQHMHRDGDEPEEDFAAALADEPRRLAEGWPPIYEYKQGGFYARHLKPWLAAFPRDRFFFMKYEDFNRDQPAAIRQMFGFVGVDPSFQPDLTSRYNVSVPKKTGLLAKAMEVLPFGDKRKRTFDPELRACLTAEFAEDLRELETLLGWDLSGWLNCS